MKLTIIIPVFNESATIEEIILAVEQTKLPAPFDKEILIVDDGSHDGTTEKLKHFESHPDIKIFFQEKNQGKTHAVNCGIKNATGDFIIIQDADLEYSPDNYFSLLKKAMAQKAPIVYGSRFLGTIKGMTRINRWANKLSNKTINLLFKCNLTDFHTCHKLFKAEELKKIPIESKNFSFDTEITAKLLKKGIPIIEIPIHYSARAKKDGKKITWGNAIETYWTLLKCRFSDR